MLECSISRNIRKYNKFFNLRARKFHFPKYKKNFFLRKYKNFFRVGCFYFLSLGFKSASGSSIIHNSSFNDYQRSINRNIYLKILLFCICYYFLGKLYPELLFNGFFCFLFSSVEVSGKTTKPVIKNLTPYPARNINNNDNSDTKTGYAIYSNLTVKTPEW